jgi:hypothetical protein
LWAGAEISKADPKVIWSLLDDIWHYYTSKNTVTSEARIRKSQSLANNTRGNELKMQKELPKQQHIDINPVKQADEKYIDNYYNVNKGKPFEKYSDVANYQKIVTENVSQILGNSISKKSSQLSNTSLQTYLGIKKKKDLTNSYSRLAIGGDLKSINSNFSTIESKKAPLNKTVDKSMLSTKSAQPKQEKTCFVLFEKSNINRMKEELEKYESKNYTVKDVSMMGDVSRMVTIDKLDDSIEESSKPFNTKIKITDKNYETKTQAEQGKYAITQTRK